MDHSRLHCGEMGLDVDWARTSETTARKLGRREGSKEMKCKVVVEALPSPQRKRTP